MSIIPPLGKLRQENGDFKAKDELPDEILSQK
jgi:hypothetical protein